MHPQHFTGQLSRSCEAGPAHSYSSVPSQPARGRKFLLHLLCPYLLAGLLCKVMITALYQYIFTSWGQPSQLRTAISFRSYPQKPPSQASQIKTRNPKLKLEGGALLCRARPGTEATRKSCSKNLFLLIHLVSS